MAAVTPTGLTIIIRVASALAAAESSRESAIRKWWWLWLALVLLSFLLVRMVVALGKRRRHAAEFDPKSRSRRAIKDAWTEAGKRAEPLREDEPEEGNAGP